VKLGFFILSLTTASITFAQAKITPLFQANEITNLSNTVQGGESSGGGGGFYCPGTNTVEVLDIWEGRSPRYGFSINNSNDGYETQLQEALQNLNTMAPDLMVEVQNNLSLLKSRAKPIDPSLVEIPFPDDAKPLFVKPHCELRGIMYYDGSNSILWFNPELLNKLSQTDLAALWLHEALYRTMRDKLSETNSDTTRRIVACSFSQSGCRDKLLTLEQALPTDRPVYKCNGNHNSAYNPPFEYYFFRSLTDGPSDIDLVISTYSFSSWPTSTYTLQYPIIMRCRSAQGFRFNYPRFPTGNFSEDVYFWSILDWQKSVYVAPFQGFEKTGYGMVLKNIYYSRNGGIIPQSQHVLSTYPLLYHWENINCVKVNDVVDTSPPKDLFPPAASATTIVQ
jgi:hypothetical protein